MTTLKIARKFVTDAPREALVDALGFAAVCALIFAGFTLPTLF
jgi:hypothetical protein